MVEELRDGEVVCSVDSKYSRKMRDLMAGERACLEIINMLVDKRAKLELERTDLWNEIIDRYMLDKEKLYHIDTNKNIVMKGKC